MPNERMVLRWVRIDWRMVGIGQYKIDRVGKDNVPQGLDNRYMYLATGACQYTKRSLVTPRTAWSSMRMKGIAT